LKGSRWLQHVGLVLVSLFALVPIGHVAAQSPSPNASFSSSVSANDLNSVAWPVDFGQSDLAVFVPQTGHTVTGMMLDYWRANGTRSVYGFPISEPYGAANGLYSQAFERGVFQYDPNWTGTDNPWVRLAPIGQAKVTDQREATRADGRRLARDRRASAWTPASQSDSASQQVISAGGRFSDSTGFSLSGDFQTWYDNHEGIFYLGAPISEPHSERGVQVQYFRNGILLADRGMVWMAPLPREFPKQFGIDTTPTAQGSLPDYSESLFIDTANPYGVATEDLTGRRYIVVSIEDQTLKAYQGDQLILETLVSTGIEPNHTEVGDFHVRIKRKSQTMTGFTSSTGEVVSVGDNAPSATPDGNLSPYSVADVPNVMYFDFDAEALHGAYWHNNFGNRMSHGCVNLPLDVASFLFEWAPLGTAVTVMEGSFDS
jgi:lipoprotein-anchoring transpeptidase ErfK/SrfK